MPHLSTLLAILAHTPRWVWALLAVLIAAGVLQARARSVTLARLTVLPAALAVLSLLGVVTGFNHAAALAGWAVAAVAAATSVLAFGAPRQARWQPAEGRLHLPGSWLPLALMLGLFAVKYAVGVLVAMTPALRGQAAFAGTAGLAYGAFAGCFLGRALALRALARGSDAALAAG